MLRLYAIPGACSLAPHILLEIIGAPFEIQFLDRKAGEQHAPEYLAINPHGKVPTLKTDDGAISENVAIQLFLADRYPDVGLAPEKSIERAQWVALLVWLSSTVHPSYRQFRRPELFSADQSTLAGISDAGKEGFMSALKALDQRLGNKKWILGDRFSTADAYAHVFHIWSRAAALPISDLNNLRRHGQSMADLPASRIACDREGIDKQLTAW